MASGSDEPPEKDVKCEACGRQGRTKNWLWDHLKVPGCPCLALLGYGDDLKGYQKEFKNKERRLLYKEHCEAETARKRREVSKFSLGQGCKMMQILLFDPKFSNGLGAFSNSANFSFIILVLVC